MYYTIIDTLSVSIPFESVTKKLKFKQIKRLFQDQRVLSSKSVVSYDLRNPSNIVKSEELQEYFDHAFSDSSDFAYVYMWQHFIAEYFGLNVDMFEKIFPGKNYFNQSVKFDGGFIAWGGNNKVRDELGVTRLLPERVQIFFDAKGCEKLTNSVRKKLAQFLENNGGRITRADIAYDSVLGSYNLEYALNARDAGLFNGKGRPPKARIIKDLDGESGDTLYIGVRGNGKMLRVYEKGKQLGDPSSLWVRWEVEFTAKDRDIPLDLLLNCDKYFAGAYPVLAQIISEVEPVNIKTISRLKTLIPVQALRNHCRNGYGKLLRYLRDDVGLSADQIIDDLTREGLPRRLWSSVTLDRVKDYFPAQSSLGFILS